MKILCFGGSNTWGLKELGVRYDSDTRWTCLLSKILGEGYTVLEDGLCGREAATLQEECRSKTGFLYKSIMKYYPFDLFIMMLGTSDLRSELRQSAEDISHNIYDICEAILEYDYHGGKPPKIILCPPAPIKEGIENSQFTYLYNLKADAVEKSKQLPELYQKVANNLSIYLFDTKKYSHVMETDCMHLSAEGHKMIAHGLAEVIKQMNNATI